MRENFGKERIYRTDFKNPTEGFIASSIDAKKLEGVSFEDLVDSVRPDVVLMFRKDARLMSLLKDAKWPTEEKRCDAIGARIGLGAAEVAAVAKYELALIAEARRSEKH